MDIVYKSKVDKWFPWTICICVIALIGSKIGRAHV